ncbi:MAG: inositol monophosphatase [Anaerolineaceae bacterium]|jgi:myo-inositol-1(or 4)-monophosphatase|nr:MAG: inositol monophosphatase [Anaerolineaceae bacterium]
MSPDLNYLINIAKRAGEILMDGYLKQHEIRHKGRIDLVTEMDSRSEDYLLGEIRRDFKGHTIITEESGHLEGEQDHCWFIDPLDGTANYAHGVPLFSVTIAYAYRNRVTLAVTVDPTRSHCFSAERGQGAYLNGQPIHVSATRELVDAMLVTGFPTDLKNPAENNLDNFSRLLKHVQSIRRLGSAAIDIAYVAAGWLDGYWEIGIHPWDIAAGTLLAEEAGGLVTNLQGEEDYFKPPYSLIVANSSLHAKIRAMLHVTNVC